MPTTNNGPNVNDLNPALKAGLEQLVLAVKAAGGNPTITSGYRSREQQQYIVDHPETHGSNPVAAPGTSLHEKGLAADVSGDANTMALLHSLAPKFGLSFPLANDPVHVQLAGQAQASTGGSSNTTSVKPLDLMGRLNAFGGLINPSGATADTSAAAVPTADTSTTDVSTATALGATPDMPGAAPQESPTPTTQPSSGFGTDPPKGNYNNMQLGQTLAKQYGWDSGDEWSAFNNLVMSESGWNAAAANPTSSARGIAQNISGYSDNYKENDAQSQINWMLNYVKNRYGSPSKAWAFHQKNNWY